MNEILIEICTAAIVTAIFRLLVPDERNGKQIKLLISCFFIISVIGIFKNNIDADIFDDILNTDTSYRNYDVILEKQTADKAADNLREKIRYELQKENIIPEKIYIDINIYENRSISFNEIRLVFSDISSEAAERAVRITEKCTGNEIKVSLEEP